MDAELNGLIRTHCEQGRGGEGEEGEFEQRLGCVEGVFMFVSLLGGYDPGVTLVTVR